MKRIALILVIGAAVVAACDDESSSEVSSSSSGAAAPCNEDPASCQSGQTCWFKADQSGFECLNSGVNGLGDTCSPTVGVPTCVDDLMCVQYVGMTSGMCTEWCNPADPDFACPAGRSCNVVNWPITGGATISGYVCELPAGTGGSGGTGGGEGGETPGGNGGSGGSDGGEGGTGG